MPTDDGMTPSDEYQDWIDQYGEDEETENTPKWKTKDGKVMKITEMTDSHLLNAHRYCRRKQDDYHQMLTASAHPIWAPRGDGACEAFDRELDELSEVSFQAAIAEKYLLQEIEKRGLTPLEFKPTDPLPSGKLVEDLGFAQIYKLEDRKVNEQDTTQDNKKSHITHNFFIAGVQFHQLHKVLNLLEEGDVLELVPEPTNKFDPNAVRIEYNTSQEQIMCGYVPKKFSAAVAGAISIGKRLECKIEKLNPGSKPWEQCKVNIVEVK